MKISKSFFNRRYFYHILFSTLAFLFINFLIYLNNVDLYALYRDISSFYKIPVYAGLFSHIGIFMLTATFSICFFTYTLLSRNKNKYLKNFYKYASLFNFVLIIDDAFLLHEGKESFFYPLYFISLVLLINIFMKNKFEDEIIFFISAVIFMGISVLIDVNKITALSSIRGIGIAEDILKLIGFYYWLTFFGKHSYKTIKIDL